MNTKLRHRNPPAFGVEWAESSLRIRESIQETVQRYELFREHASFLCFITYFYICIVSMHKAAFWKNLYEKSISRSIMHQ